MSRNWEVVVLHGRMAAHGEGQFPVATNYRRLTIQYKDFVVQVGARRDNEFRVRVLESPAGQGEGSFRLPWNPDEWACIRASMVRNDRDLGARKPPANQLSPHHIGEELFQALFSGQVGLLWARSIGVVPSRGLRVQLRFKLDEQPSGDPTLPHSLPWELLRQPDTRDFLALSRLTPVVRYLEVPRPAVPFRRPSVLLILVVISAPAGLSSLDSAREWQDIQQAWGDRPEVEVDVLEKPRASTLREALLSRPYNILHFIGHAKLDTSTGEGCLVFEDKNGAADPISAEELVTLLKDLTSLRLVFLNACDTARTVGGKGLDPFAGVATALVMAGLPAVVAMQFPISDDAAIAFSRTVHLRLAAGEPLDTAVTEGRQAIFAEEHSTMEWAIPVVFTRVADGFIFNPRERRFQEALPNPGSGLWQRSLRMVWPIGLALCLVMIVFWALIDSKMIGRALSALPRSTAKPTFETVRVGSIRIGRYEVTQRQFLQFVLSNQRWRRDRIEPTLHDGDYLRSWISWREYPAKLDDHPVTQVSWYAAEAFCEWAGGRLPQLEEWQTVAHTAEYRFPWGSNQSASPLLNFCDRTCPRTYRGIGPELEPDGFPETASAGSFPAGQTREGVFDLSGNVWEWTAGVSGTKRASLGGSYLAQFDECSTEEPVWEEAALSAPDGGFRCLWK